MEWININGSQKPETGTEVLLFVELIDNATTVTTGHYDLDEEFKTDRNIDEFVRFTHWAELSEPPK